MTCTTREDAAIILLRHGDVNHRRAMRFDASNWKERVRPAGVQQV